MAAGIGLGGEILRDGDLLGEFRLILRQQSFLHELREELRRRRREEFRRHFDAGDFADQPIRLRRDAGTARADECILSGSVNA